VRFAERRPLPTADVFRSNSQYPDDQNAPPRSRSFGDTVPSQSEGRSGDSRLCTPLNCLTNTARFDGFSDFIKGKRRGGQLGPEGISLEKHRTRERASR
jgi:hypothetical protein